MKIPSFIVSKGGFMERRGMSGFGIIVLLIILLVIGYVAYQIGRVHFTYGTISEKVKQAAETAYTFSDYEIVQQIIMQAKEAKVELNPDSIYVDRSIPDSIRIYVAYDDSSDIFGVFTYNRHLTIDRIEPLKAQ